jgi:hypothetical protein
MTEIKKCFLDQDRPCDLTCKAAFEVDDPLDNVDCYFIWLAHHLGESLFDLKRVVDGMTGGGFPMPPGLGGGQGPSPKGPKGPPSTN